MLKRIKKIQNIGRFADCNSANCEFGKETIIFGYNTRGKSTITAILHSIRTGNNDILIGRKTFGAITDEKVEIDFEEKGTNDTYIFQNRAWNKTNPNIMIFDSKFIAENIFEGENITFDQQKNLHTIIIGEKGKKLFDEINALQNQSDELAKQKSEKTREFNRHFPDYDINKFEALSEDINIDEKIRNKDKEIKFEKEKEDIKKAIKNHIQTISSFRFSIRDILEKTLNIKQDEIEAHIRAHFSTEKNAHYFLKQGLDFLKDKPANGAPRTCVFCGQNLSASAESLIALYSAYFKKEYEQLQIEINKAIDYFKELNIEATIGRIASDLRAKDLDIGLDDTKIRELSDLKQQFEKELEKKRDLNYAINFESFDCLKNSIEKIKSDLKELEKKKLNIPSLKTVSVLEKEKRALEIIKKRFEPVWIKFCEDIKRNEAEAKKVREVREAKRKELENYSSVIFDTHKKTINRLCGEMCADFEVEDFKPLKKIIGRDERIFAIKFFGAYKVNIDNENDTTPNFQNTLSESDRRLLAFVFFISLLLHDIELDKKIIIFDDPMSSFDSERCRKTVQLITDIACKYKDTDGTEKSIVPRQRIILTHEDRFAKELARLIPSARTLKIEEYVDAGQKRSKIVHADFAQDFPYDDISNRIEKIKGILDTRAFTKDFETDCRVVLEHIFKRKYYLELKNDISQRKSVRTFTTKLTQDSIGGFDDTTKSQKFIRLCDDLNIELHDGTAANSNGDKESILKDFFECLKII